MKVLPTNMHQFTSTIFLDRYPLLFHFEEVLCPVALKYFVTVNDKGTPITSFEIKKAGSNWQVIQPAEEKIVAIERELGEVLQIRRNRVR